jgi:tripartite-type tricarboxylate transporter receptor subunit TctC
MRARRIALQGFAAAALAAMTLIAPALAQDYPNRPITMIVPWGAGGGTDILIRALSPAMEQAIGQPINVVNRTGGSGLVGHTAMAGSAPDGYNIGTINVDLSQLVCQGLTDLSADKFTQIALLNVEHSAVIVNADSDFNTLAEAIEAIKSNPPGTYTASGSGTGSIYHLAWVGLMVAAGIEADRVTWVPSQGGGPSLQDVSSGAVDFITPPLSDSKALLDAGKIKALATMSPERNAVFPDVPTIEEAIGVEWNLATWRMIGAPAGLPDDVKAKLLDAIKVAYDGETFQTFMKERGFAFSWLGPEEARAFHAEQDKAICDVMKVAGMVE